MSNSTIINMIDLASQQKLIKKELNTAIAGVLERNDYISGTKVFELEQKLAEFSNVTHAISCANGTDALILVLMAKQVTSKNAIFVPAFTFAATVEAVILAGATPVFVDVLADTFNMDPNSLEAAINLAKKNNLNPTGIIPVDLFGLPADYEAINQIALMHDLWVLCDAAQSFGASYRDQKVGNLGIATTTSFFPSKPLGCYGDGGCILTNDSELAPILTSLKLHGAAINNKILDRYNYINIGMNSRLDTIQAAILIEKLKIFPNELVLRNKIAENYNNLLASNAALILPKIEPYKTSSWAQYTIKLNSKKLDPSIFNNKFLQNNLQQYGIASTIYYPKAISSNKPYLNYLRVDLKISENLSNIVLSLPMHPYLTSEQQEYIADKIKLICIS